MPLFDVPGWTVPAQPVADSSVRTSKKRKRPSNNAQKFQAAEVNLEKLVKRLTGNPLVGHRHASHPNQTNKMGLLRDSKPIETNRLKRPRLINDTVEKQETIPRPKPLQLAAGEKDSTESPRSTKAREKHARTSAIGKVTSAKKSVTDTSAGLTPLQRGMKRSLDGARFRVINESLYKTDSRQAYQTMKDDPRVFADYHTGFRHQVELWPTNPVNHYISDLSSYPQKSVIADLGCGDAALARALIPKGINVLSFDLVSDGIFVIEADICGKIPLPGSEGNPDQKSSGDGHVVDVVVCALSLMSTNWPNCLREAWRILKTDGELKIAEVASRFTNVGEFQTLVRSIGFQFESKDDSNSHFTLFEFKKIPRKRKSEKEWASIMSSADILKPCEYKRR